MSPGRYRVEFTPPARRALAVRWPEKVATAAAEFCLQPLADNPYRVGTPLHGELTGCHGARRGGYRVIYRIDDATQTLYILDIAHRGDAYRAR
ncbi:MAG: type II toxin-antitoxin system RelE family toxin [Streptomycetales bacterium]